MFLLKANGAPGRRQQSLSQIVQLGSAVDDGDDCCIVVKQASDDVRCRLPRIVEGGRGLGVVQVFVGRRCVTGDDEESFTPFLM
jgi:hypothetical protein